MTSDASDTPPMPPAEPREPNPVWLLTGMVVIAAILRWPLMDRSIWFDEACMSDQRIGTFGQWIATLYVDIHPPLFVSFMHFWNERLGDGEFAMRLPALLSGLLCIPMMWWSGHRLIGHRAALWAAALLVLSPVHVWYCAEARLYAPMILCTLLAFGTTERLLTIDGRRGWLWLLHLLNVAVMLALHYYLAVFVVVLATIAPFVTGGFGRRTRSLILWHGAGIALLAAFVLAKSVLGQFETSQTYLTTITFGKLADFVFTWCWTGNTLQGSCLDAVGTVHHGLGIALIGLGALHTILHRQQHPRSWLLLVGVATLPAFLFGCLLVGLDSTYLERSLIPALPFVLLLAGHGLQTIVGRIGDLVGVLAIALAATALVVLYQSFETRWTVYKPHPDWRAAAAYLGNEIDSGGAGRPVFTSMPNPRSLSYYDPRIQDEKNLRVTLSPDAIANKVRDKLGDGLADFAHRTFTEFADHQRRLLREAKLVVRPSRTTAAALDMPTERPDELCYVVRNEWHPHVSVDGSVEALLRDPAVEVVHTERLTGVTVYKVRIAR